MCNGEVSQFLAVLTLYYCQSQEGTEEESELLPVVPFKQQYKHKIDSFGYPLAWKLAHRHTHKY